MKKTINVDPDPYINDAHPDNKKSVKIMENSHKNQQNYQNIIFLKHFCLNNNFIQSNIINKLFLDHY